MVLGKDLLIAMGGRVIAAQRTCNLNMQQDTIEVCSPVSGPWREYIPSTLGWDVSCDGLIYAPEYADELMEVLTRRQKVRLSYYDPELRIVRSGYAIPTGLQQGASISDLASYSLTFQGTGELARVEPVSIAMAPPAMIMRGWYISGSETTHKFDTRQVTLNPLKIYEMKIQVPSCLIVKETSEVMMDEPMLLCKAKSLTELTTAIQESKTKNMLAFYSGYELNHYFVDHNEEEEPVPVAFDNYVLAPGTYYLVGDISCASVLSLPTT